MRFVIGVLAMLAAVSADHCQDFCARRLNFVACGFGSYCKNEHACHNLFWTSAAKESIWIRGTAGCVDTHLVSCAEARSGLVITAAPTSVSVRRAQVTTRPNTKSAGEARGTRAGGGRAPTAPTTRPSVRGILEAVVQVPLDDGSVRRVRVYGSVFNRITRQGDFTSMITDPAYNNTLFVFNDNQPLYEAFRDGRGGCSAGGNNAAIRPFQCLPRPRAAGIPTGIAPPGYMRLDDPTRRIIDEAVDRIRSLVTQYGYEEVVFSQRSLSNPTLGMGIFAPARPVRDYIVNRLLTLGLTI